MDIKKKNREWLFILFFPIGYLYINILKNMNHELGNYGVILVSLLLLLCIIIICKFSSSTNKEDIDSKKHIEPDDYVNGVQIVMHLPKQMPLNPYFLNGEKFLKMKFFPKYTESILAVGIVISFFLPWVSVFFTHLSPYDLVKLDNFETKFSFLLIIPFLASLLMFLSNHKKIKNIVSLLLGITPFLLIFFMLDKKVEMADIEALFYGFYFCLFLSIFLIVLFFYRIFKKRIVLDRRQITFSSKKLKLWLALGMLGTFFLPWLKIGFFDIMGYKLLVDEHYREMYWFVLFIPLFAIILATQYRFNMKIKQMAFLTGLIPYVVFVLGSFYSNTNLFSMLTLGAYMTLFFGVLLMGFSLRCRVLNCIRYQ